MSTQKVELYHGSFRERLQSQSEVQRRKLPFQASRPLWSLVEMDAYEQGLEIENDTGKTQDQELVDGQSNSICTPV